jgi:hypothetical protein
MSEATYNDSVFVNCPFDDAYQPMLRAIVFTVYRCGFLPQSALGEDNALDNRIDKIIRIIGGCRYGIHDISRTESNAAGLPRFNMPFELGLFFGAKRYGNTSQKMKVALIFERTKYLYQQYISDISGVDIKDHGDNVNVAIRKLRDWLKTASKRERIPGAGIINGEYQAFAANFPAIAAGLGFDPANIPFNDYCTIVEEYLKKLFV